MQANEIEKFIGADTLSVSQAMQKIDNNNNGILFILDANGVLSGCVTDGDIRRYLLSGGKMEDMVVLASNTFPKYAKDKIEAKELYHSKNYIVIPIVDSGNHIVDLYFGTDSPIDIQKKKSLDIPVVINAGGKGTRLDPFTRILPKPLIPVGSLPILEHIMQEYKSYDCNSFHVIVNYKKELIKAYFAESENRYSIHWYDEEKPLGTGGGIRLLQGNISQTFFFTNCDVLIKADYGEALEYHRNNHNMITMICAYKNMNIPYGVVEISENGVIEAMKEKPMMSFLTNTGMYIVEPEVIEDIEDAESISFPEIIERERKLGERVAAFPVSDSEWMDMGQLDELEKMRTKIYGK